MSPDRNSLYLFLRLRSINHAPCFLFAFQFFACCCWVTTPHPVAPKLMGALHGFFQSMAMARDKNAWPKQLMAYRNQERKVSCNSITQYVCMLTDILRVHSNVHFFDGSTIVTSTTQIDIHRCFVIWQLTKRLFLWLDVVNQLV